MTLSMRWMTSLTIRLDSDGPVTLQLPDQWLWDILDEFIYQFQSFSVWRSKVKSRTEEELSLLIEGSQVRCDLPSDDDRC